MKLLDNVFLVPCPAPDDETRCRNYQSALKALSVQLDELAISIVNNRHSAAENIFKNLLSVINKAYDIAL